MTISKIKNRIRGNRNIEVKLNWALSKRELKKRNSYIGMLEVAILSLEESELETIVFVNDVNQTQIDEENIDVEDM